MRERHDDNCAAPFEDNHLTGPTCPTAQPKRKKLRKPYQVSVRGETYDKIAEYSRSHSGVSIGEVVDVLITRALDREEA